MSAPEASRKITLQTKTLLVLVCAVTYFYAYHLNLYWFDWIEFSHGVNWIYIPSGLRLLFVLLLARLGGIGIAVSTIYINYTLGDTDAHVFNIVTGIISGASPCIAYSLARRWFHLDPLLVKLTGRDFFKLAALFAVVNALLHQVWYFWADKTPDFLASTLAMAMGDWFGSVLVLATVSFVIQLYKCKATRLL